MNIEPSQKRAERRKISKYNRLGAGDAFALEFSIKPSLSFLFPILEGLSRF
jgi:hypothetical protein